MKILPTICNFWCIFLKKEPAYARVKQLSSHLYDMDNVIRARCEYFDSALASPLLWLSVIFMMHSHTQQKSIMVHVPVMYVPQLFFQLSCGRPSYYEGKLNSNKYRWDIRCTIKHKGKMYWRVSSILFQFWICTLSYSGTDLLAGSVVIGQGGNGLKLKEGRFRMDIRKTYFFLC